MNNLAEAKMMMKDGNGEENSDGEGLSFGMLSRLISEGRAGEVPVKQIPEGTNVGLHLHLISPMIPSADGSRC